MSISSNFVPTQGFHPVLQISVTPSPAPAPSCRLFSLISVPPSFIIDRYQLSQLHVEGKLGIQDGNLEVLGEGDLEGPTWKAREAAALIQLSNNASIGTSETKLEVPLHMRYQQPAKRRRKTEKGLREDRVEVKLNQPRAFWACTEPESSKGCPPSSLSSDFTFQSLSNSTIHDLASGTGSSCTPTPSIVDTSTLSIILPTGIEAHSDFVGPTTVSVIWLGFFYLVWTALNVRRRTKERSVEKQGGTDVKLDRKTR
ncbi:hypothetical protein JCM5350_007654 [Sporobolomyces pararoseus]